MKGLLFIYLLTAFGAVGGLVAPLIGLFVYVGFATLRPQFMWGFAGNFGGISQYVGLAMLVGWAARQFGKGSLGNAKSIVGWMLAFTVWAAISAFLGINQPRSTDWVVELLKTTLPFLVGVTMITSSNSARWMLWIIVGAHGYISYEMNSSYYLYNFNRVMDQGYGGMDNNSFGLSLVTALGPAMALGLAAKKWPERMLAFLCAAMILHTIILTYSRGSMLGLIVTGFAAFFVIPKRPSYLALGLVGFLLFARLAGPEVIARFETTFADVEERDGSAQSRVDLWRACLDIASKNPLFGIGPRNFPIIAPTYGFTPLKEAHSTWMQTAAEMGFVGVGALLMLYLTVIFKLWPIARQRWTEENRLECALAAGVMISLAGFFVSGQFVSMTGLETPYYVAMVGAALIKNVVRRHEAAYVPAQQVSAAPLRVNLTPPSTQPAAPPSPRPSSAAFRWPAR